MIQNKPLGTTFDLSRPLLTAAGGAAADAFGRQRVSTNLTLFDYVSRNEIDDLHMDTIEATSGTVTYDTNTNHIALAVTADSGSRAVLQSHNYLRYQPGKSGYVKMTCNFKTDNTEEFAVVQRSSTSGSVVDDRVTSGNFNGGLASSGFALDLNKGNLYFIDFAYLGVGPVRFSVISDKGQIINLHTFRNPSANDEMYLATANLPFRAEVYNDGANTYKRIGYFDDDNGLFLELKYPGASAENFNFFCCAVESEGGDPTQREHGHLFCASTAIAGVSVAATEIPLLSIRPKATYGGKANRGSILLTGLDALVSAKNVRFSIYYNPTLTGASFNSVNADSITEFDIASTAFSGGTLLRQFYLSDSSQVNINTELFDEVKLSLDAAGTTADILTVTAVRLDQTALTHLSLNWKELN